MSSLKRLLNRSGDVAKKHVVAGFDGFIDTIARTIRHTAADDTNVQYFETISQFGQYLTGQAKKSCSVGLKVSSRQPGGNMPNLSRALANLGIQVSCIGMLGADGAIDPLFQDMPCNLYPFAAAVQSMCLEFTDGKVMLAPECTLTVSPWTLVMQATDGNALSLFQQADLIALVNWSELDFSQQLWQSVYDLALASDPTDKERYTFFDLCDCSRKSAFEMDEILKLIGQFAEKRTSILSLNENEAHIISAALLSAGHDAFSIGRSLRKSYGIDEILIHTAHDSFLITKKGETTLPSLYVRNPKILTGAGDNFNAAFCFGLLAGLDDLERLDFACRFTSFYITWGRSPKLEDILLFQKQPDRL